MRRWERFRSERPGSARRVLRSGPELMLWQREENHVANEGNRGRSDEARDPNRPTYTDPVTGETEKEGLGPRDAMDEPIEPENPAPVDVDTDADDGSAENSEA